MGNSQAKNRSIVFGPFEFCLFVVSLESMNAWFLIGYEGIVFAFTIVFFGLCVLNGGYTFTCRIENILSILTYLVLRLYIADHSSIASILGVFLRTFVVGIVILLPDNQKELILNFFTKWFSIIILVSLIGWILVKIGLKLPYGYCSFGDTVDSHKNYFIFLEINNTLFMQDWRFMSIFSEPGYLAMISCLLLFINGFDFRDRSVLVIFLGGVLASFSFAGYALFIVGFMMSGLLGTEMWKKSVSWLIFLISVVLFVIANSKVEDSRGGIIANLVLSRLRLSNGSVAAWNRFSSSLNEFFIEFMTSDHRFLGIGFNAYQELFKGTQNAGYKVFIVCYGIIGVLLLVLFYMSLLINRFNRYSLALLILYGISFIQRSYATWDVEVILFIIALPRLETKFLSRCQNTPALECLNSGSDRGYAELWNLDHS